MSTKKSMIDVAYATLTKHNDGLAFEDLFNKVVKECGIKDDEKAKKLVRFYNNLTLDGRFCHLEKKNLWTLRHGADNGVNLNEDDNTSQSQDEIDEEEEIKKSAEIPGVEEDDESEESEDSNDSTTEKNNQ